MVNYHADRETSDEDADASPIKQFAGLIEIVVSCQCWRGHKMPYLVSTSYLRVMETCVLQLVKWILPGDCMQLVKPMRFSIFSTQKRLKLSH